MCIAERTYWVSFNSSTLYFVVACHKYESNFSVRVLIDKTISQILKHYVQCASLVIARNMNEHKLIYSDRYLPTARHRALSSGRYKPRYVCFNDRYCVDRLSPIDENHHPIESVYKIATSMSNFEILK